MQLEFAPQRNASVMGGATNEEEKQILRFAQNDDVRYARNDRRGRAWAALRDCHSERSEESAFSFFAPPTETEKL